MAEIYKMPLRKELEMALAFSECRFLPVLERVEQQRLDAEQRLAKAEAILRNLPAIEWVEDRRLEAERRLVEVEAMARNREVRRVHAKRRFDFRGRLAAFTALLAAILTVADSIVAESVFSTTVIALFIATGTLCVSALASANAGLGAKVANGSQVS